jgi:hypothetical protein
MTLSGFPAGRIDVTIPVPRGIKLPFQVYLEGTRIEPVLTNNGSGGFGFNATLSVGSYPFCFAAGDVNGDGKPGRP